MESIKTWKRPEAYHVERKYRVYVDMCGDVWHFGHALFIMRVKDAAAKRLQTSVDQVGIVVGLFSDAEIENYKRKTILNLHERIQSALGCFYVDEVITGVPIITTIGFMNELKLDLVGHADDFSQSALESYYSEPMKENRFVLVSYGSQDISTSQIIERCKVAPLEKKALSLTDYQQINK